MVRNLRTRRLGLRPDGLMALVWPAGLAIEALPAAEAVPVDARFLSPSPTRRRRILGRCCRQRRRLAIASKNANLWTGTERERLTY